ncbi:acid protease [Xylaria telfairii]|nr:acid protease [Xylaria telfairii]
MIFILLLAFVAICVASDTLRNGAQSLRLPIRSSGSSTIGTRDDPHYGHHPLRTNATQKHYLSPYTVELSVGTPPQLVYPALDLFTKNVWLNPDCYSSLSIDACCANGKYNPEASTSAGDLDCTQPWDFNTPYSGASGCYVVDDIEFAGASLDQVQVGVASESWGSTAGRLGLGFGCRSEGDISIVDELKSQGLIATRQFSIALGSANPSAGTMDTSAADVGLGELLFSGLNTRKYAGELRKLYSHPAPAGDSRYYVTLTALGLFDPSNCVFEDVYEPARRAFFDYSTIISYLPSGYIEALTEFFPDATYNYTEGVYQLPCYYRSHEASVDFYFDTLTISVPLRDFILEVHDICYLGAVANTEDEAVLGQSFLRAAYTAFDLDDEAIYMAQYENCGDQLINWDSSAAEEDGLCASRPSTLPSSCYEISTSTSSTSTTHSTSHSTSHSTTTTHSKTSTTHSTTSSHHYPTYTSTSRSTSQSSTHTSTHSTTSKKSSSTKHSSTSSKTTSSTHSTYWPRITSSSHTTGANHTTTSSPWSSGRFLSSGFPTGGSQPSSGFSWSNVSFTPGSTSRFTPKPTSISTLTSVPASTSETSTLTSLPASTSTSMTRTRTHPTTSFAAHTQEKDAKTVTVTVGVLTSTMFMPSPITVPGNDCKCAGTVTVTREPEDGVLSCDAVTEYRTRTVSDCRAAGEQTPAAEIGADLTPAMLWD